MMLIGREGGWIRTRPVCSHAPQMRGARARSDDCDEPSRDLSRVWRGSARPPAPQGVSIAYQICTRFSGAMYSLSPGLMSNAVYHASRSRIGTIVR